MTDYEQLIDDLRQADNLTADHRILSLTDRAASAIDELTKPKHTDHTELIHDLRYCADRNRPDCSICGHEANRNTCNDRIKLDAAAIESLQAQLPKRGEWINSKERMRPDMCSVCGCVYEADRFMDKIAWNYCPNCGSLMVGENDERN